MPALALQIVALILLSCVLGIILGVYWMKFRSTKQLRQVEARHQESKANLSDQLSGELAKIRDSIVQTVDAYENVISFVEKELGPSERLRLSFDHRAKSNLEIDGSDPLSEEVLEGEIVPSQGDEVSLEQVRGSHLESSTVKEPDPEAK